MLLMRPSTLSLASLCTSNHRTAVRSRLVHKTDSLRLLCNEYMHPWDALAMKLLRKLLRTQKWQKMLITMQHLCLWELGMTDPPAASVSVILPD